MEKTDMKWERESEWEFYWNKIKNTLKHYMKVF